MFEESRRLHPASILLVFFDQVRRLALTAIILLVPIVFGRKGTESMLEEYIAIGFGILTLVPAILRYMTVRYSIADGAFTMTHGVIYRQKRVIPLERIQNVSVKRSVLQRLMKVSAVQIETAAGTGAEAELTAISDNDVEALIEALERRDARPEMLAHEPPPVYRASLSQLLLAGASQNRAGLILVFLIGGLNYVKDVPLERLVPMSSLRVGSIESAIFLGILALATLLFAGWIVSIIKELVSNYGFELRREDGVLRLSHGLFTQVKAAVPVRRIQMIQIEQPVIQRYLGYSNVFASSAASYSDKSAGGAARLAPIIETAKLTTVTSVAFPTLTFDNIQFHRVSKVAQRRGFLRNLIVGLLLLGAVEFFLGPFVFAGIPVVAAIAYWGALRRYRIYGFAMHDGFLIVQDGVWKRTLTALPENCVQWIAFRQGPLARRLQVCNVQVVTAAAGRIPAIVIQDLPEEVGRDLASRLAKASAKLAGSL